MVELRRQRQQTEAEWRCRSPQSHSKHLSSNGHINPYFTARLASYTDTHKHTHMCGMQYIYAHTQKLCRHFHISVLADVLKKSAVWKDVWTKYLSTKLEQETPKGWGWKKKESGRVEINPLQCSTRKSHSSAGRTDSQPWSGEGSVRYVRKWSWTEKRVLRST